MKFTKSKRKFDLRSDDLGPDEIGPGLYRDETVFKLDSGELVALSVNAAREPQSQGTVFTAWARQIEDDGRTVLDPTDGEVETTYMHNVCAADMRANGVNHYAKDLLLLMLGEVNDLGVSDQNADAANIREAIKAANAATGALDVAAMFGGQE